VVGDLRETSPTPQEPAPVRANLAGMHPTDHIQIVTFRLAGLSPGDYAAHCEAVAPQFAQIDGLRAKAWIADARTNTYGGIYAWESEEAMEAYVHGPVFGALRTNPLLAAVSSRDFTVLEPPTRISWAA
jgi:hypothetical protein